MTLSSQQAHWDHVYASKGEAEVSWYEDTPQTSMALLAEAGLTPDMAVIDIGGGTSRLVDALVSAKQAQVSVLDLSAAALAMAKARLVNADLVQWIVADVTTWVPDKGYALWHDRAAFHFLTAPEEQRAYVRVLERALSAGGRAIIGTFAPDGPEKCSGLTVVRYDAAALQTVFGRQFRLVTTRLHHHVTPSGAVQKFQFSTFERLKARDVRMSPME